MKFAVFNLKEPKVNNNYGNVLDDLGQECEIKTLWSWWINGVCH